MKSFRRHLIENREVHHHVIIGRMNPPHIGHELGVSQMEEAARETGGTSSIFLTRTKDSSRNPLTPEQKKRFAQSAFPGTKVEVATDSTPTLLHHVVDLANRGVTHLHIHAGSDRAQQYYDLLNKYNGVESKHGKFKFKQITVHSIGGERGGEGVSGASATKMRSAAASGDREAFHAMAPSKMSEKDKDEMMRAVQGGLKEWIEESLKKACWDGYEAIGMKKKNGRMVPNCVPVKKEEVEVSEQSFGSAFKRASNLGKETFYWRGKPYSTQKRGEQPSSKPVAQAPKPEQPKPQIEPTSKAPEPAKPQTPPTSRQDSGTKSSGGALSSEPTKKPSGPDYTLGSQRTLQKSEPAPRAKSPNPGDNDYPPHFDYKLGASRAADDQNNYRMSQQDQTAADVRAAQQSGSTIGSRHGEIDKESGGRKTRLQRIKEATHEGRQVTLNKPFRTPGGPKKSAVYVDPDGDGKAKIVRFGDPKLSIKKDQPSRKKSYCARSSGQGNLTKKDSANYWSRRAWDC